MHLRVATRDDLPALLELATTRCPDFEPWWVTTLFEPTFLLDLALVVEEAEQVVGFGAIGLRAGTPPHQRAQYLFVARGAEDDGVGRRIFHDCLATVGPGVTEVWGRVFDDDDRAIAVTQHWGFETVQRSISSRIELDPATVPSPRPAPGVTLELLDDLEFAGDEAAGASFDAMLAASQTNPEAQSSHLVTREEIRHWIDPGEVPLVSLARVGGVPAAVCFGIGAPEHHEGGVAYTGVDPAYRGRALGRLVKEHVHHHAASVGIRRLTTDNEENNTGIRHVNEQLGYTRAYGVYRVRKVL